MVEASSSTTMTFFLDLPLIQQRAHFAEQGSRIDGLGEIAVHAEPKAAFLVLHDGQNDDGDVHGGGIVLENGRYIEAIHFRHHDVEDHQAGSFLADEGQRLAAVFGETNGITRFDELLLQQRANVGVVIDNQNGLARAGDAWRHFSRNWRTSDSISMGRRVDGDAGLQRAG